MVTSQVAPVLASFGARSSTTYLTIHLVIGVTGCAGSDGSTLLSDEISASSDAAQADAEVSDAAQTDAADAEVSDAAQADAADEEADATFKASDAGDPPDFVTQAQRRCEASLYCGGSSDDPASP
ncbi:MAG: hypothetical protein AAF355_15395 [Myxococcota bacterium]